jgi:hypothetical protein
MGDEYPFLPTMVGMVRHEAQMSCHGFLCYRKKHAANIRIPTVRGKHERTILKLLILTIATIHSGDGAQAHFYVQQRYMQKIHHAHIAPTP